MMVKLIRERIGVPKQSSESKHLQLGKELSQASELLQQFQSNNISVKGSFAGERQSAASQKNYLDYPRGAPDHEISS